MTLQRAVVSGAMVVLLAVPQGAHAGGWWSSIDLESSFIVVGERVEAHTEFLFRSIDAAERARGTGRFYAYLIQDFEYGILEEAMSKPWPRGWWRLGGGRALRIGTVVLSAWDANLARARAEVLVPDVPPGSYALMFCDWGCVHPLGDIVPTRVTLVADPLTVRLRSRLDRLNARTSLQAAALHAAVRVARSEGAEIVRTTKAKIAGLQKRIERLESGRDNIPWLAFAGWLAAGVLLGALVAAVLIRRGKSRESAVTFNDLELDAKPIRELASSRR